MKRFGIHKQRRGVALIYAVFGAFVAGSMVAVMLTAASVTRTKSDLKAEKLQARYLAEGGVEAAKKAIQSSIANWKTPPANGKTTIDGIEVTYTVATAGAQSTVTDPSGIETIIQPYEVVATAKVGDAQVLSHRLLNARSTPLFQYAVFYTKDLEINPGPNMTLMGRVHTNESMYLGCGNTLTLDTNYVRSVGDMFRRRKDTTASQGTVTIRKWVLNPFAAGEPVEYAVMNSKSQMTNLGIDTTSGYDTNFSEGYDSDGDGQFLSDGDWLPFGPGSLEMWGPPDDYSNGEGFTVLTGDHGMTEAVTPSIGSIKMFEAIEGGDYAFDDETGTYEYVGVGAGTHSQGFFHANADLKIIVSEDGTSFTATDGEGNDVSGAVSAAVTLSTVFDSRQGGGTKVATVNLGLLAATGYYPENGLLYCGHYGMNTGTAAKGIQLTNGAELYKLTSNGTRTAAPLTVVTEGSLYVKGDYNTVNKVGAAVIADAVNLLSNAWTGTKDGSSLPAATNTTYNVAMITGNHETETDQYNGGLENLPRFHENWTNKRATIKGSFVNTWFSDHATSTWVYGGNRYTAPLRVWSYDTAFNRSTNLPPFTPVAVSAEDIVSW